MKRKRCPKGTRRNAKTGACESLSQIKKTRKRCPNGTRRHPKTGDCVHALFFRYPK